MKNYPFVKCLNPTRIRNIYTNEWMTVSCGHCKSCMLEKAHRNSLLCDLESTTARFMFFVTLTYDNYYVPRATFVPTLDENIFSLVDKETGEYFGEVNLTWQDRFKYERKFNINGDIPYLRKTDLQLFLKRLRKYVYKKYGIRIRFYAVGEYGPKHLRPHYHLLLWSESKELVKDLEHIISEKWSFGRTDTQLATGNAASYVSGYTNSFSFVPPVLKINAFRPFCTHSQKLGCQALAKGCKEVYETPVEDFIRAGSILNGQYKEFNLWRSYYTWFFPKCRGYSFESSYERLRTYRLYEIGKVIFPNACNPMHLARLTFDYIFNFDVVPRNTPDVTYYFDWFISSYNDCYVAHKDDFDDFCINKFYRDLYISYHFLDLCHLNGYSQNYLLSLIENFYSRLDMIYLKGQLSNQDIYFRSDISSDDDLALFYDNVFSDNQIIKTRIFSRFQTDVDLNHARAMKHKLHNDLNRVLFSD